MTRRICVPTSIILAAHQRSAEVPFCQLLTFTEWVRARKVIDSMLFVQRSARARVGETPRHSTVSLFQPFAYRRDRTRVGVVQVQLLGQQGVALD